MAELNLIGRLESGSGFADPNLLCRWELNYGGGWRVVSGATEGQSQTDMTDVTDVAFFSHPIDVHLATRTIQGWPKLHVEVWRADAWGRQSVAGYGFCHVPTAAGEHWVDCATWRPAGGAAEELLRRVVGGGVQLRSAAAVYAAAHRDKLNTVAAGTVRLQLAVLMRNFDKFGIEC